MEIMDIIVMFAGLGGFIFSWRKIAQKMASRLWIIRHFAGALVGSFVFIFTVGISLAIGIIEPVEPNKQPVVKSEKEPEVKKIKFKHENMLLSEYMEKSKSSRQKIAADYVKANRFPDAAIKLFHTCLSDMSRNKSQTHTVGKMMGWCLTDYQNDPDSMLTQYINYDDFEEQFGAWDGSHFKLESLIKNNMNDPSSYKHVKTTYRIVNSETGRYALVTTTFRGKNGFGAVVTNTVVAKTNVDTGNIIEIVEQR